ncbi:TetR/AcrR family transcriptional regulator [Kineococcus arenarius]|uniref:TetR/AcrR family transcriptional regulator n=1 Tax=unclassified Kineococcus TaxID=2621656 RepID=UPI003D7E42D5
MAAAQRRFLADGYPGTTLRAVASDAGVDVALISYYFGSKQGLFAAAMTLAISPSTVLTAALKGDPAHLPERIVGTVISTWDDPDLGPPLQALVVAAMQDPAVLRVFREFVEREIVEQLAERLGGPDATARATAVVTCIAGVIFARYVIGLGPVAAAPAAELTWRLAPLVRAALAGPRPPQPKAQSRTARA